MILMMMVMLIMIMMRLMVIHRTNTYVYFDDTGEDAEHRNDSYTAAGVAPGAIDPRSLFSRMVDILLLTKRHSP